MNEKKEFLTEENYEKGKKTLKTIALVVLIVGLLIGGSLITVGIIKTSKEETINVDLSGGNKNTSRTEEEIQIDIDSIQSQIDDIDTTITKLEREKIKVFQEDMGFSDRYYDLDDQIKEKGKENSKLQSQLSDYKSELFKVKYNGYTSNMDDVANGIFNTAINGINKAKYAGYYMGGGFVIFVTLMISGSLYLISKRREITAFTVQQTMPLAKEGIEKMAPTVGGAVKEVTKGVKEGLNESDKDD